MVWSCNASRLCPGRDSAGRVVCSGMGRESLLLRRRCRSLGCAPSPHEHSVAFVDRQPFGLNDFDPSDPRCTPRQCQIAAAAPGMTPAHRAGATRAPGPVSHQTSWLTSTMLWYDIVLYHHQRVSAPSSWVERHITPLIPLWGTAPSSIYTMWQPKKRLAQIGSRIQSRFFW